MKLGVRSDERERKIGTTQSSIFSSSLENF
jgi:hypothetical protein